MPCLKIGEETIGQTAAINFYLASEMGLMGTSLLETAKIISIEESLKDMLNAWQSIVPYGTFPTESDWDKWFTGGATDFDGPASRVGATERYGLWYAHRLEKLLSNTGYAVGNQLSLADVLIYNLLAEELKSSEASETTAGWRFGPFGNKERTDIFLQSFPKLRASIAAVASNENIQKWLAIRGVQNF
jgi:glutathione S-transferase